VLVAHPLNAVAFFLKCSQLLLKRFLEALNLPLVLDVELQEHFGPLYCLGIAYELQLTLQYLDKDQP